MDATTARLARWIDSHSPDGGPVVVGQGLGTLRVRVIGTEAGPDGSRVPFEAVEEIPATLGAARKWLGY